MKRFLFLLTAAFLLIGCEDDCEDCNNNNKGGDMVAAKLFRKLDADKLQENINTMNEVGVKQLYIFPEQVDKAGAPEILDNSGIELWLIAPIFFNDENASLENPQPKWAIDENGETAQEKSSDGSWLKMVCPNDEEYLDYRIEYLKKALRQCNFTGVSLDFIRYFVFWEGVFEDTAPTTLRNTCFCDVCKEKFEKFDGDWTEFKCKTIDDKVRYIITELRSEFPDLKVNLHAVPWLKDDFDGAIKKIAGQDFQLLAKQLDQIAPMTYSKMLKRNGEWINKVVSGIYNEIGNQNVKIIPAVQIQEVYSGEVSLADFEDIIKNAIKYPSSGVMVWQWEDLTGELIEIIKNR